jgi:chromosome condensin MukBEF ATPase and DNA-binding subunit MukB
MNINSKLITDNPQLLLYLDGKLHITILGGIKLTGFDRLKVTLKLVNTDDKLNVFRHNLDLYNSIQAEQLIEKSADALDTGTREISTAITGLTTALEQYRSERLEAMKPKQPEKKQLTEAERKAAIAYLKAPKLLERTKQAIGQNFMSGNK